MIKTYTLNSDSTKLYIATYQIDSMGRTTLIDDNTDITQIEYDHLNKVTHLNVVVKETGLQILDSNTKYDYLNSLQKTEFVMGQYHTRIQKDTTGIRISLYENKLLSSVQYYTKSTLNPYHSLSYFRYIKDTIHINTYLLNSNQNTQYRIDMKILERKRVSTRVFSSNNQIEYIGFIEFIDEMPCHFYGEYKTFPYQRWGIELEYISTTGLLKKVTNSYQGAVLSVIYYDYFH